MRRAASKDVPGYRHLLTVSVAEEYGVVAARQRSRQLAALLGFDHQDQIKIATATSEIARNALQYGANGRVEFFVDPRDERPLLVVRVTDAGGGIPHLDTILTGRYKSQTGMGLGLSGTRRLMDQFSIDSTVGKGTTVTFAKVRPTVEPKLTEAEIARLTEQLTRNSSPDTNDEIRQQNQDLLVALDVIRKKEAELERRQADMARINQELEETNRGVVALYAELDERASALRQANDVKTRFLSYMSHEFRTPLNSILALSDLLLRRTDGELEDEQERQIRFIRTAAQELFEMVNDLLDIAKVEAGKVELRTGQVEVAKLFGALRGMMRPLLQTERVNLIFEDPLEEFRIVSDEGKIGQILRNLISNALKYTEQGEVQISAKREGDALLFCVCDTGIGIAPDHQEAIFREFSQVENPLQRKVRGTGLGLPLSRKLAELLGGTLEVVSAVGQGSTFTLTLPLMTGEAASTAATPATTNSSAASAAEEKSQESILVIDDEEIARYLARQLFRGTRFVITEANGGIEGLDRARFDRPRLILLDITMPDRNGFEVLQDLKSDPATKDIPVVLHTSSQLSRNDLAQLDGRYAAILPKGEGEHGPVFAKIRELLGEPHLFSQ